MNHTITELTAVEILDSRGRPTLQAACRLASGAYGEGSVPSGASTGRAEALELRDGDPARYNGLGCRRAAENVNTVIQAALAGRSFATQQALDAALIALDGTPGKARLGANALLAASVAFARAAAAAEDVPLFDYFGRMQAQPTPPSLPGLTVNLFSGGKHAGGQVGIQDVLLVPLTHHTIDEGLAMIYAVYQAAAALIAEKYGMRLLTADEGGLAPPFETDEAVLADAVAAIARAGFTPGEHFALAVDVAASHFYSGEVYTLGGQRLASPQMVSRLIEWAERFPLISIEDGLAEDDWAHWPLLRAQLPAGVMALGDDLLCTNPGRIQRAAEAQAANALLLKVNQIGTFTEALEALRLARAAGWGVVVSARSGETEDHWLADLAVGWGADYIKVGSITQSERLAKYNRLLILESRYKFPLKKPPGR